MEKKTLLSFFKLKELIAIFWVNNMIVVFDAILNKFFFKIECILMLDKTKICQNLSLIFQFK